MTRYILLSGLWKVASHMFKVLTVKKSQVNYKFSQSRAEIVGQLILMRKASPRRRMGGLAHLQAAQMLQVLQR